MEITWFSTEPFSFDTCKSLVERVSKSRQEKIFSLKKQEDKLNALFLELLMRYCISKKFVVNPWYLTFGRKPYGKPFCVDFPQYAFSVAHAGYRVVFCGSNVAKDCVGVDVEKIVQAKQDVAEHQFTSSELSYVKNAKDKNKAFFEIWTRKEAYLKMLGIGLRKPLNTFDSLDIKQTLYSRTINLGDYVLSAISKKGGNNIWQVRELTQKEMEYFLF